MFTVRKEFKFCYAHQLYESYTTLCHKSIHGHNAKVEVFLKSEDLDHTAMVVDFGQIKDELKDYIDGHLDHALFMPKAFDEEYLQTLRKYNGRLHVLDENPTAELFAKMIYNFIVLIPTFQKLARQGITLDKVIFWETDSSYAEYTEVVKITKRRNYGKELMGPGFDHKGER